MRPAVIARRPKADVAIQNDRRSLHRDHHAASRLAMTTASRDAVPLFVRRR
jgi:hypothetical protein